MITQYYNFTQQKMFNQDTIAGVDVYILTAYFIDPKTICQSDANTNRKLGVVGTGLWLQNGTDPVLDSFSSPIEQSEVNATKWVQGACFVSMGRCIYIIKENDNFIMKIISRCSLLV